MKNQMIEVYWDLVKDMAFEQEVAVVIMEDELMAKAMDLVVIMIQMVVAVEEEEEKDLIVVRAMDLRVALVRMVVVVEESR